MERQKLEKGWNQLRYDTRTYTTLNERNRTEGVPGQIPDQYRFIGDKCFFNNGKVHGVILPSDCRVIGKQAFEGCQFRKKVEFPDSLVEIKKRAFAGNRRLRVTTLPDNLEKIGAQCYRECNNLRRAEFSSRSKCRVIPEGMFDSCLNLEEVCLPPHTQVIDKRAFYRCKELRSLSLPDSIREIGEEAFYFCGIEELTLPKGLKVIGDSAFFRCKNLKTVYIPESVQEIGRWAFHGCSRLERIEILHDPEEIGPWIINKSCTIVCQKDSKVDEYAQEFGFKTEYIEVSGELDG